MRSRRGKGPAGCHTVFFAFPFPPLVDYGKRGGGFFLGGGGGVRGGEGVGGVGFFFFFFGGGGGGVVFFFSRGGVGGGGGWGGVFSFLFLGGVLGRQGGEESTSLLPAFPQFSRSGVLFLYFSPFFSDHCPHGQVP